MAAKKEKLENKVESFFSSFAQTDEKISFRFAHEALGEKPPIIHSGSYALDDSLSCGGYPKGRIIQLYGEPSSGKSLMAMLAIKEAQKESKKAMQLFIDAEQTASPDWMYQLGIDTSRVVVIDGDDAANGRKCFEMLLGTPKEDPKTHVLKGKSKEGFFDKVANGELNFNMCVLDSLGQIIPPGEDTASVGKLNMAKMATFLTTTFKKVSLELSRAQIPFIVINHKRDNLDPYGISHKSSGGNTYFHSLSANIYFESIGGKDGRIVDENDNRIGQTIQATIEKSKFGPFPRKCRFKVIFTQGIISGAEEIFDLACNYNVIGLPTSKSYEYGDKKWVGRANCISAIEADESLQKELLAKIEKARDSMWEKQKQLQDAKKLENLDSEESSDIEDTEEE